MKNDGYDTEEVKEVDGGDEPLHNDLHTLYGERRYDEVLGRQEAKKQYKVDPRMIYFDNE